MGSEDETSLVADGLTHSSGESRVIVAVDLDYFYAQCEEVRRPELKNKPVVVCVYSGRTKTSGAVSTANYVARRFGVKSGMPIITAMRLLKDEKDSEFLPVDDEYYRVISHRIMQLLRTRFRKFEQVSIDESFVDVTAQYGSNFEGARQTAIAIKHEIKDTEGLKCSVGIAPNKTLAKMAADVSKPDGLTIILPHQIKNFLEDLPIGRLIGIGHKTEKKMKELGIVTIGDLAKFDSSRLALEFGKNLGPHLKLHAQGIDDDEVRERPVEQLSRIVTLKQDADSFDFKEELRPLAEDLAQRLTDAGEKSKVVGIIAITTSLQTKSRARTTARPIDSAAKILELAFTLFSDFFSGRKISEPAIRRVGIRLSGLISGSEAESVPEGTLSEYFTNIRDESL